MPFSPRLRSRDPDLSQSSYLVLPVLIALGLAMYYKESLIAMLTLAIDQAKASQQATAHLAAHDSTTESFLSEHPKKKYKSRKT